ncbi:hypothetical protein AgCh_029762 [Apium graveolens]
MWAEDEEEVVDGLELVVVNREQPGVGVGVDIFHLGLEHLGNDARINTLIQAHPVLPVFNRQGMNTFENMMRALIEEGGSPANRHTRFYQLSLSLLCHDNINPVSVAGLGFQQLVNIGVQGRFKAEPIITFAGSLRNYTQEEINDLNNLTSHILYRRIKQLGVDVNSSNKTSTSTSTSVAGKTNLQHFKLVFCGRENAEREKRRECYVV